MQLCSQIEQLEKENKSLREGGAVVPDGATPVDEELLRLQAENAALQKNVAGTVLG